MQAPSEKTVTSPDIGGSLCARAKTLKLPVDDGATVACFTTDFDEDAGFDAVEAGFDVIETGFGVDVAGAEILPDCNQCSACARVGSFLCWFPGNPEIAASHLSLNLVSMRLRLRRTR